jgi:hypothetical protein
MPETPNNHDDQDDDRFDRLLRDAGTRMRAATQTALPPAIRTTVARGTPRRWIVPVAIVMATAAAVVAAVWLAGPATESVREVPADTGVDTSIHTVPDSAVDSVPIVAPVDSTPPSDTTPADSVAPVAGQPVVSITDADFDGAGGMCLRFVAETGSADACLTHRQLEDTQTWTVAFAEGAFELVIDPVDAVAASATAIDEVCGYAPSALTQARWLNTSCSTDQFFWFVAAPELPGGESTTYVVPPRTSETIALEPIESALPDGLVAYRANYEEFGTNITCLLVASFPDPWREACVHGSDLPRMFVPTGGSVFLVEPGPDVASVEVQDIAVLSVPIAGCTSPVTEIAAAIPESNVMISELVCAGDSAMITVPAVFLQHGPPDGLGYVLGRAADGTWSTVDFGTSFRCSADTLPACETLGVDGDVDGDLRFAPLPVAPLSVFGARIHDLDPVEITADVRSITVGAREADEIAAAVIARYGTPDAGEGHEPVVAVDDGLGLVTVDITLLDDSASHARYYVWYRPTESGELRVERAYTITACSRGIAAPDTCV